MRPLAARVLLFRASCPCMGAVRPAQGKVKEISLGMNDHTFVTRFVKQCVCAHARVRCQCVCACVLCVCVWVCVFAYVCLCALVVL
jgi:hypothetical protein